MKNPTFAQRIKEATLDAAAQRHMNAVRTESLTHPEVKRAYDAIPAAYKRQPKWCSKTNDYVGPNQYIYIDVASYSNMVTINITLNGLKDLKKDKRLTSLLATFLTPEWTAQPTTDCTWSEQSRGRVFSFYREVSPHRVQPTHPSVKWLRKQGRTWNLDAHMNNPLRIRVVINAYVKEDNETCRIEVTEVREEVVRTEVKRLVCA
jgi:hypothetical protein